MARGGNEPAYRKPSAARLQAANKTSTNDAMSDDPQWNAALESGSFDGRLLVDISSWDCTLRIAVNTPTTRLRSRFQGGLEYDRHFQIQGRIRAPAVLRDK